MKEEPGEAEINIITFDLKWFCSRAIPSSLTNRGYNYIPDPQEFLKHHLMFQLTLSLLAGDIFQHSGIRGT